MTMLRFYQKAILDILENRFLNTITVITIALSVLIVSAFILFFANASDVMNAWKSGIRVMAYLKPGIAVDEIGALKQQILGMYGVQDVNFISKTEAMDRLKQRMRRQSSILENLRDNPLPDALEICMIPSSQSLEKIENLAKQVESLSAVDDIEYGQAWIGRFYNIFSIFKFGGYAVGGLFFMATVFIVANTIRLVLYSRREEVEIMRLVGATDRFIQTPFYFEGIILGGFGGLIGQGVLFGIYLIVSLNVEPGFSYSLIKIRFFSLWVFWAIFFASMCVGWLGCYLSLKQFLTMQSD
jgi:cell division transport system permease protein